MLESESAPVVPSAEPSVPAEAAPGPLANGQPRPALSRPASSEPAEPAAIPAAAPQPKTPADLEPLPTIRARLAWYGGVIALTVLLLAGGLRLDQATLRAPLAYEEDVLLILPMV